MHHPTAATLRRRRCDHGGADSILAMTLARHIAYTSPAASMQHTATTHADPAHNNVVSLCALPLPDALQLYYRAVALATKIAAERTRVNIWWQTVVTA